VLAHHLPQLGVRGQERARLLHRQLGPRRVRPRGGVEVLGEQLVPEDDAGGRMPGSVPD
jgi:hypothetical protein